MALVADAQPAHPDLKLSLDDHQLVEFCRVKAKTYAKICVRLGYSERALTTIGRFLGRYDLPLPKGKSLEAIMSTLKIYSDVWPVFRNEKYLISRCFYWCPGPESNRHGGNPPRDFKSLASTNFATRAWGGAGASVVTSGKAVEAARLYKGLASKAICRAAILSTQGFSEEALSLQCAADRIWGSYSKRNGGAGRNRTGVYGVAVRCITTLPPRLF